MMIKKQPGSYNRDRAVELVMNYRSKIIFV